MSGINNAVAAICLLFGLLFSSALFSQEKILSTSLTLRFEDNTLPEAFDKISAAAGVEFSYDPAILPTEKRFSTSFRNASLEEVLDNLLKETGLGFIALNRRIIIKPLSEIGEKPPALFTLNGFVRDSLTGEELIGANVLETALAKGCSTNEYGFYSLTLPEGAHALKVSYLGYEDKTISTIFDSNLRLDFYLKPRAGELATIVVTDSVRAMQENRELGEQSVPLGASGRLRGVLGEKDVLKTAQLLPGITSAADGISSFGVRGGSPDQTLILLDEAPVYNPTHLLGFYSIFNADALKEMKLMKGAFPAQYGGRLASVVEVFMKEGNANRFAMSGGIGLTSAKLQLEAPVLDKQGSFMVSGRRTYQDWLIRGFKSKEGFHFLDGNLKGNVRFGSKDRLFVAGYFGRDVLKIEDELDLEWGNATATLR